MDYESNSLCGNNFDELSPEFGIWLDRWFALEKAIDDTSYKLYQQAKSSTSNGKVPPWAITLKTSLKSLKEFGKKQFCFLLDKFNSKHLAESPDFRKEFAFRRTLDQIAYDLTVMQQIRDQRLLGSDDEKVTLMLADNLAYKALEPAIKKNLLCKTTVLTYLQKAPNVRVVPYAPIAIIGVPRSAVIDSSDPTEEYRHNILDLLATVHEIGHYVYWHGRIGSIETAEGCEGPSLQAALRLEFPEQPAWRLAWLEEIFADVYGVLIAGPIIAYGIQNIVFDNLDLLEDDNEHPQPVIRPFIYNETLRQLRLFNKAAKELENLWEKKLQKRGFLTEDRQEIVESEEFKEIRTYLQETIARILGILQPLTANRKIWTSDTDNLKKSIEAFKDFLRELDDRDAPPLTPTLRSSDETELESAKQRSEPESLLWTPGKTNFKNLEFLEKAQGLGLKLPPGLWTRLLDAGGWSTAGPETGGNPA
ncbi:MAG: hypothetical protein GY796_16695 [Chloroflexi bacterium]|nr:hypothetical protein [Chloroflexota bacterium]